MKVTVLKHTNNDIAIPNEDAYTMSTSTDTTENESMTNKLLMQICEQLKEIHDVLDTRDHEEQQRYQGDKENQMKNDWMLAAAILDRSCAIVFVIILFGGTAAFFVLFANHP